MWALACGALVLACLRVHPTGFITLSALSVIAILFYTPPGLQAPPDGGGAPLSEESEIPEGSSRAGSEIPAPAVSARTGATMNGWSVPNPRHASHEVAPPSQNAAQVSRQGGLTPRQSARSHREMLRAFAMDSGLYRPPKEAESVVEKTSPERGEIESE